MSRFPVAQIRSVEMGTPDIAKSEQFYLAAWGLTVASRREDVVYLRGTGLDHHILALHPSTSPEILSVTFRVRAEEDLRSIATSVVSHGGAILEPLEQNQGPEGGRAITLATPEGYIFRFVFGDELNLNGSARRDHTLRLAHVNLNCADIQSTQRRSARASAAPCERNAVPSALDHHR